jgi:hypothetical protein
MLLQAVLPKEKSIAKKGPGYYNKAGTKILNSENQAGGFNRWLL